MYSLKPVFGAKAILNFENMRIKSYGGIKIKDNYESPVAMNIVTESSYAYICFDDEKPVGGMVIKLPEDDKNIVLEYLFTNRDQRKKGVASYMLNVLVEKRAFFTEKDYEGIILQSKEESFDFYIHRGFEMVNDGPMLVKKYPY